MRALKLYVIKNNFTKEIVFPTVPTASISLFALFPTDVWVMCGVTCCLGAAYYVYEAYEQHLALEAKKREAEVKKWDAEKKYNRMLQEKNPQKIVNTDYSDLFEGEME